MKDIVRIALMQMDREHEGSALSSSAGWRTPERIANDSRPDLMVFPDLSNCNDVELPTKGELLKKAEEIRGAFTRRLGEFAAKYRLHVIAGLLERDSAGERLYNSAIVLGPDGQLVGVQRQLHTMGDEKAYFDRGESIETVATPLGTLGLLVGTDFDFPEVARVQVLRGAEILCALLHRKSPRVGLPDLVYHFASCRAFENRCYVIVCNRAGSGVDSFCGKSCVMGGDGQPLAQSTKQAEDILIAELSRDKFYEDRADKPYLRDRRPEHYGLLAQQTP